MVEKHGIWSSGGRLTRRRLLAVGTGASVAFAAACGGKSSKPSSGSSGSASAGAPRRGGTLRYNIAGVPPSLDPYRSTSFATQQLASLIYSRLLKYQTGPGVEANLYTPVPDLATSYEAPDASTWTFKLRADAKMHDVAPTNGRAVTAQDVVYSFQRVAKMPSSSANSDLTMIDGVTAPDAQTVQVKLKYPYAPFLNLIASPRDIWIVPHELDETGADKGGDAQQHMVGSGPFLFKSYQQGQSADFTRSGSYWEKDKTGQQLPYLDGVTVTFLNDSNAILSQFQAGHLDTLAAVTPAQLQAAKQQNPRLQDLTTIANATSNVVPQLRDNQPPLNDVRVRRAISLAMDRDALSKQLYNGDASLDDVALPAGMAYWYLDPKGKDIGPGGAWYKYDPQQAKQLLAAAGYGQGLTIPFHYTVAYGATWAQLYDALPSMLQAIGITLKMNQENYQSVWIPQNVIGNYDGMILGPVAFYDPDTYYTQALTAQGAWYPSKLNDPQINNLLDQERRELDRAKRRDLVWQIQRYASDQMFLIPLVTGRSHALIPPAVHNYYNNGGSFGVGSEVFLYAWKEQ